MNNPDSTGTSPASRQAKLNAQIEAGKEIAEFRSRITVSQPAIQTFTNEALMFMFLTYGKDCLKC
jgi:hypothetical protein